LTEHFTGLFQTFLKNLTSKNYAGLEKITEKRFLKQLQSKSDDLGKFQLKYTPNSVEEATSQSYMID